MRSRPRVLFRYAILIIILPAAACGFTIIFPEFSLQQEFVELICLLDYLVKFFVLNLHPYYLPQLNVTIC
jgi:hypothetical protein